MGELNTKRKIRDNQVRAMGFIVSSNDALGREGREGVSGQVVEGIRGAAGRLEVAIADLARKLAPRSARMTTKALKRDLAALERLWGKTMTEAPKPALSKPRGLLGA